MRTAAIVVLLLAGIAAVAAAADTSDPAVAVHQNGWIDGPNRATVLLIETTDTFLEAALTELGVDHDVYESSDFSGVDLSGYLHVFVAMDGGLVEDASIAHVAEFATTGGCLHFYGGTAYQDYVIAMNEHLLANEFYNYQWQISAPPHSTVVDANHYLALGLPPTFTAVNPSSAYYMFRSTDDGAAVAAVNGDGYAQLLSKAIGAGMVDMCINSSFLDYYTDPVDYGWGLQVVGNMLSCDDVVASQGETWGGVKALFR